MNRYRMHVIAEPAPNTRIVMVFNGTGVHVRDGGGDRTYACGKCDKTILQEVERMQVQNMVWKCNRCGAFNEVPLAHQTD